MNEDTRVAICCYAGDAHQMSLPLYTHHECPVTILSPDDSRAEIPGFDCRFGGKRAYIGQDSLDRQAEHLRILLDYPENHFLIHDSDSVVLDPILPAYLYAEPDIVWSNQVFDDIPEHQPFFPEGWPHVAFQPPYFLSRTSIERMLAVKHFPLCAASPCMPFIDFYMVQLTLCAQLPWKRLLNGLSFGITLDPVSHPSPTADQRTVYGANYRLAANAVRNEGANILHSVKDPRLARELAELRRQYVAEHPDAAPKFVRAPHIGRPR